MQFGQQLVSLFSENTWGLRIRSDVLRPLAWIFALLIGGLLGLTTAGASDLVLVTFLVMIGVAFIIYIAAFVFFGLRNPDALRSETYSLRKQMIEKGLIGDDRTGLFAESDLGANKGTTQATKQLESNE